jgi:uncharacterized membrane protein
LDIDKRPITVSAFEVLNIVSVVLEMVLTESDSPFEELFWSALWVALTLSITRGRSRAARIIYTCIIAFGGAACIAAYALGYVPAKYQTSLALRFVLETALLMALLWWPSTTDWLKKHRRRAAA